MNRRVSRAVAALAAAVLGTATMVVAAPAYAGTTATTWYVEAGGNDSGPCTMDLPCGTIGGAVTQASPNDVIAVGSGIYSDPVQIAKPITVTEWAGTTPDVRAIIAVNDAAGLVGVSELNFSHGGGIVVNGNTGSTTLANNQFSNVAGPAIALDNPGTSAMSVLLDGNHGTVTGGTQTIANTGTGPITLTPGGATNQITPSPAPTVEVTAATVIPNAGAQQFATLGVPASEQLSNPVYDVTMTSVTSDYSNLTLTDSASGPTTLGSGAITATVPYVDGPTSHSLSLASTAATPRRVSVSVALDEYWGGTLINQLASGNAAIANDTGPTASNKTLYTHANGSATPVDISSSDPDGDTLSYTIIKGPSNGTLSGTPPALSYTATGTPSSDSFTYQVSDGPLSAQATVTLDVNQAPTANAVTKSMLITAQSVQIQLGGSDPDSSPSSTLSYAVPGSAPHGGITFDPATHIATYTPDGTSTSDSFTYTVSDGLDSSQAKVQINRVAGPIAYAPQPTPRIGYNAASTTFTLTDAAEPGATVTYNVPGTTANNGTLTPTASQPDGTYTYSPNGTPQSDSFSFTVTETLGGDSFTSTPTTVNIGVNHPPTADAKPGVILDQYAASTQVPLTGSDPESDVLTFAVAQAPAHGIVTIDPATDVATYTPTANSTPQNDSFTYTASDGQYTSAPAKVTVTYDLQPTAKAEIATIIDTAPNVTVTLQGVDQDGTIAAYQVPSTAPQHGKVTFDLATKMATYTPNGTPQTDTFTYTVTDNNGFVSAPATVTINVNHHPVAQDVTAQSWGVNSGAHTLALSGSDAETAVTYAKNTSPMHGTVKIDPTSGVATYTANTNFVGGDTFTYHVSDRTTPTPLISRTATVSITITKAAATITNIGVPGGVTSADRPKIRISMSSRGVVDGGQVRVSTGGITHSAPVFSGIAEVRLPNLTGGSHVLTVTFTGTSTTKASGPKNASITVSRASSTLSATTSPQSITTQTRGAVATVHITPGALADSGRVTVRRGGSDGGPGGVLTSGTPRNGTFSFTLPTFPSPNQYNFFITYTGNAYLAAPNAFELKERVPLG